MPASQNSIEAYGSTPLSRDELYDELQGTPSRLTMELTPPSLEAMAQIVQREVSRSRKAAVSTVANNSSKLKGLGSVVTWRCLQVSATWGQW